MSRLPNSLQPVWPLVKRLHRLTTRVLGTAFRRTSVVFDERALPRRGTELSRHTAAREPNSVRIHVGGEPEQIRRQPPVGTPAGHWSFLDAAHVDVPERSTVEVDGGTVVGEHGAVITADRTLDLESSGYFGISGWREHPIFLRPALPRAEHVAGSLASLASPGGAGNYYHFLLDVLPRWGILQESLPGFAPDRVYVPSGTGYERELLAMTGLDQHDLLDTDRDRAFSADHLLVPSHPNPEEVAPSWTVEWLRNALPPAHTDDKPRRLYVTRGSGPNTRRLVDEATLWPRLERRGFVRIDPGSMSVRDQIDHFAAADVVVGIHGAALTNLVFLKPGARVLHLFAPGYVKHCFWAICEGIPDVTYQYLVGEGRSPRRMTRIQQDVRLDAATLEAAVDRLLA